MRVLICGAGIAGLATALRLPRWGHQPVIVERAPANVASAIRTNEARRELEPTTHWIRD